MRMTRKNNRRSVSVAVGDSTETRVTSETISLNAAATAEISNLFRTSLVPQEDDSGERRSRR
jgi:hypothetical protein